jgi:hypothetical protein
MGRLPQLARCRCSRLDIVKERVTAARNAIGDTLPLTPKHSPVFAKVQRAKSVILDGKHLFPKERKGCGGDFYGVEKQTRCDGCLAKQKKRAS